MKIAMIYPNVRWNEAVGYQAGLAMLTTILQKAGHDARFSVYYGQQNLKALEEFDPDLFGYYYSELQQDALAEIMSKFPTKYHLAGGPYPTLKPACINDLPLDAIFRGEADRGLLRFVESGLKDTSIPGFVFKTHSNPLDTQLTPKELQQLPQVTREPYTASVLAKDWNIRWESKHKGALHFAAGRGCPYSCNFCANKVYNELWKPSMRYRTPEAVVDEILEVASHYVFGTVVFADDIVTLDAEWFGKFITLYTEKVTEHTLILNTRVDCITQEQMRLLKKARCVLLRAGIESGSTKVRELMGRPMSSEDIYGVYCQIIDAGLRPYGYNLIGYPGETIEDWQETLALNMRIANYAFEHSQRYGGLLNVFFPYKGTAIGDQCYANNWVDLDRYKAALPHQEYILRDQHITNEQIQEIMFSWRQTLHLGG